MTRRPLHMELAGLSLDQARAVVDRAFLAEQFVVDVYDGELREPGDQVGDVDLTIARRPITVDVKSVPTPLSKFVDGGRYAPAALSLVVSRDPHLVLGLVEPDQWTFGQPPVRSAHRCWHVRRADVFPPPAPWIRIGCVVPAWYDMSDDDINHADWNDRNHRRNWRRDEGRPLVLPGVGDETSPSYVRGTGLASRKGHAPGKDNARRKRPR